jgi:hypothetical protein
MKYVISAIAALMLLASTAAASITIGVADPGSGNFFPFTGDGFATNNRYQQAYAASNFSGPVTITGITFFNTELPGAVFETADYTFTLSTSANPVNGLDTVDLNNNPGGDAALFASLNLSGATGASFTIVGTPFLYDPSNGPLLIDITRANQVVGSGTGYLDAMSGTAAGIFSRAHNYDSGFEDFGLVTRLETGDAAVPEPVTLVVWSALFGVAAILRRRFA